jgi:ribosomal protein S18 acetylase RimI-like enzyme
MKILQLHKLNKQQIKEVEALVLECLRADGLERTLYLDNDINFYINLNSFFLLYEDQRLVSVLVIFEPVEEEAEISAYTLPSERKKGYFKALLQTAVKELLRFGLNRILFVTEPASESGLAALKACKANYCKSEYLMSFKQKDKAAETASFNTLVLKELSEERLEAAANLSSRIFNTDLEEALDVIAVSMGSKYMKCYGAFAEAKMIGICNISYGVEQASIFGFGILPDYQGKGYGRRFLKQIINLIQEKGFKAVTLHVGSENNSAYALYKSEGFVVQTQYDYYEYLMDDKEL